MEIVIMTLLFRVYTIISKSVFQVFLTACLSQLTQRFVGIPFNFERGYANYVEFCFPYRRSFIGSEAFQICCSCYLPAGIPSPVPIPSSRLFEVHTPARLSPARTFDQLHQEAAPPSAFRVYKPP
ncbi:unnamed protein product [Eretmochelys imbricata]